MGTSYSGENRMLHVCSRPVFPGTLQTTYIVAPVFVMDDLDPIFDEPEDNNDADAWFITLPPTPDQGLPPSSALFLGNLLVIAVVVGKSVNYSNIKEKIMKR
ncbi:unnamed protein product [Adineta ricciae]|uniref:Uncharacterized protein n=1 Tax=Adineta ricciae TaxID=249248 RepID=A0A815KKG9_ADIRI|nr:unnamed protein product [Adineta ricciae]CAF1397397.1 unnamed protein product [Adineta ricciae]